MTAGKHLPPRSQKDGILPPRRDCARHRPRPARAPRRRSAQPPTVPAAARAMLLRRTHVLATLASASFQTSWRGLNLTSLLSSHPLSRCRLSRSAPARLRCSVASCLRTSASRRATISPSRPSASQPSTSSVEISSFSRRGWRHHGGASFFATFALRTSWYWRIIPCATVTFRCGGRQS